MVRTWGKRLEVAAASALVLAIGIVAFVHEGVPAAEVELNDGGVWVTNGKMGLVGHLNYESRMLDGGVRSDVPRLDVSQFGSSVVVLGAESVQQLSPASVAFASEAAVPGIEVAHGGEKVLFTDPAAGAAGEGKVWVGSLEQLSFRPESEPLLEDLDAPRGVVGVDGDAFVVTADGTVREITGVGEDAVDTEVGTLGALANEVDLTVVGSTLVVLDGDVVRTLDRATEIPGLGEHAVLQQPSLWQSRERTPEVLVASSDGLWRVPLNGDEPSQEEVPAGGEPARPAVLGDCAYGLWKGTGHYLRHCADETLNVGREFSELAEATDPRFRVNRRAIVINDLVDGAVYLPVDDGLERVDDWAPIAQQIKEQEGETESEEAAETELSQLQEFSEEQSPPVAKDDRMGVRPGASATLPVLLNDIDPDGDVLTAVIKDHPGGIPVSLAKDGRAARVEVPADVSEFSFTYQAFDGADLSNVATVTVKVSPNGTNEAPTRVRSRPIQVAERASVDYAVLPDWTDPDGDPVYLEKVTADEGLSVTWRPDGHLTVQDQGKNGPGERTVTVVVGDGSESAAADLTVQVTPATSNTPPVANNDHYVTNVGESVTLHPLANDTDADGDALRLVELGDPASGVELVADYNENTAQFTATAPGTQTVVYAISDGSHTSKGKIRVDVIDPATVDGQVAAENDLALLPTTGTVVLEPLNNDFDPAGGVLVIQGVSMGSAKGLNAEVVRHSLLRVTAPAGLETPQTFAYTVSNGTTSATASVLVVPLKPQATVQPPVALPETTVVRAGDIVTVGVLANDYSPGDLPITLRPELDVRSDAALGEFFVSGDQVRFRAGAKAGTAEAIYTVEDSQQNIASSTVTVSIRGFDEGNQRPSPRGVTGRAFSGASTDIAIPLDGIDPDGDSVELLGIGGTGPSLGAVEVRGNVLAYTASEAEVGTDVFTYRVTDRFGAEAEGLVRVGIAPAPSRNQAPVAVPDDVIARPGVRLEIPAADNDLDPDGDPVEIVAGSLEFLDDDWEPEATVTKKRISVTTPKKKGIHQLYYTISDRPEGRGATAVGVVTVTVDENAPLIAPIARDDYVSADAIAGVESVEVPVLDNDLDPDGATQDLVVEVEAPAVAKGATVTVPVAAERQILLYAVRDPDGKTARAAIVVPGRDQIPPVLNPAQVPARVKAGGELRVTLGDFVLTRPGHDAILTTVDSVVAGRGGSPDAPHRGATVIDDRTIVFAPDADFHGTTSLSFEVTDGESVEDPRGLTATLSLPIVVEASELSTPNPPVLRPGGVRVAPGEAPVEVSLSAMVDDPDPGDNERMAFAVVSAPEGVAASVRGQSLSVSVPADTKSGEAGGIVVSVHDGSTDPLTMEVPVTLVPSTRPLMSVTDVTDPDGRVGVQKTFNLADYVTNPFAAQGGAITLVGEPEKSGAAAMSVSGLMIAVTPQDSGTASDAAEDVVIRYTVADATGDSSRYRTGAIRLVVKNVPLAPGNVTAEAVGSRTARVSWTHSGWRGGQPDGFTVFWDDNTKSKDCGLQTSCDIDTLANNDTYTFRVAARVKERDIDDSAASAPSNEIFVDVVPSRPVAPVTDFGDRQIDLTWAPATVPDGGSPVTSYIVEITPADALGRTRQSVSGTARTWDNLVNGTAYTFTLTAQNRLTELDSRVTAPKGPASSPQIPAGAPSNQGAPTVRKDTSAAGVSLRATVSWSAPGNSNGDTDFLFQMRQVGTQNLLYEGPAMSSAVNMTVGEEDKTYEVRVSNKSRRDGKWSEWSSPSNAVRAFQAPGQPTGLTVTPTRDGARARFDFGAAAGNGARQSEISYRWDAGGASGSVTPGQIIESSALVLGRDVPVQVRAISTVNGETAEGPAASATVNAFSPPVAPVVSARGNANDVTQEWSMPETSNGRAIARVQLEPGGEVGRTGTRAQGNGRNQTHCIRARAQNSEGQWGPWSDNACASTWGNPKATFERGAVAACPSYFAPGSTCKEILLRLERYNPNSRVGCPFEGQQGSMTFWATVDSNGNWGSGRVSDGSRNWVVADNFPQRSDITDECHY